LRAPDAAQRHSVSKTRVTAPAAHHFVLRCARDTGSYFVSISRAA
jgi:hypothetical protein